MGHRETYQWLAKKRKLGDKSFFCLSDIKHDIKHGKVSRDLAKLWKYNLIEVKQDILGFSRRYRAKIK